MKEKFELATKAHEAKQAKITELKNQDSENAKAEFKEIQTQFVKKMVEDGLQLVDEAIADQSHKKPFVDILRFSLPPKRENGNEVEFNGRLYIELMEGAENEGYEDYFQSANTQPTLELLRKEFAPFNIHYGYFRSYGNVIQVRWDDTVPKWALTEAKQFEDKKAVSRNRKQEQRRRNNRRQDGYNELGKVVATLLNQSGRRPPRRRRRNVDDRRDDRVDDRQSTRQDNRNYNRDDYDEVDRPRTRNPGRYQRSAPNRNYSSRHYTTSRRNDGYDEDYDETEER